MNSQRPTFRNARDIRDWLVEHHRAAMRSYDDVLAGPMPPRGRLRAQTCRALESETAHKYAVLDPRTLETCPYVQYASSDKLLVDEQAENADGGRPFDPSQSIDEKPLEMLAALAARRRERPKGDVFEALHMLEKQYVQQKARILAQDFDMYRSLAAHRRGRHSRPFTNFSS